MTRDYNYLTHRGIRMVFDYGKLRQNYKVKPFSLKEYNELNDVKFIPKNDEMEERVFSNFDVMKFCIRIDIDKNKFNEIEFNHPIINYTQEFNRKLMK